MDRITATKTARLASECDQRFSLSENVKNAIANTNREAFVPAGFRHSAYKLDALPMGAAQWISSPLTVAKMSEYLQPKGADRVLEVGCGLALSSIVLALKNAENEKVTMGNINDAILFLTEEGSIKIVEKAATPLRVPKFEEVKNSFERLSFSELEELKRLIEIKLNEQKKEVG